MKKFNTIMLLVYMSVLISISCYADTVHVMQKGETLYSIAKKYDTTVEELIKYNQIEDPRDIKIGSRIKIRTKGPITYLVKPGDTYYGIAKAHGISLDSLLQLNGLTRGDILKVGDKLLVPVREDQKKHIAGDPKKQEEATEDQKKEEKTDLLPSKNIPISFWPHDGKITYIEGKLRGIHFSGNLGDPVTAVEPGEVVWAGPYRGYGKVLIIQSKSGYTYVYGGNGETFVQVGDIVQRGMKIAHLGILPKEGTPTLFFSVFKNGKSLDLSQLRKG